MGERFVRVTGLQTSHISVTHGNNLVSAFVFANFLSARDEYTASMTDMPAYILTLKVGDATKTVTDYAGGKVGLPDAIEVLERLVDEIAGTAKWVRGKKR